MGCEKNANIFFLGVDCECCNIIAGIKFQLVIYVNALVHCFFWVVAYLKHTQTQIGSGVMEVVHIEISLQSKFN